MKSIIITQIGNKYNSLSPLFDERTKRLWAAAEAQVLGWGGITAVEQATGINRQAIRNGIQELENIVTISFKRCRKSGGGRKKNTLKDETLLIDLPSLVESSTMGNPMNPLLWSSKSLRHLATELNKQGHQVSHTTVGTLPEELGYSLQANRKTREGTGHPDRNVQFQYINEQAKTLIAGDQPVISVDTKKKENLGNFSNKGREYQVEGHPIETKMHDFPDKDKGKAIPYGIYDLANNKGFVHVGIDHDTAAFAVNSIRTYLNEMGKECFPKMSKWLITADSGGSNGRQNKLWKVELQKLADEFSIDIMVCHFPPGTSKWNKTEHRLFSYISKNWRGRPLIDMATVVNLIAGTKTETGLTVCCVEDRNFYPTKIKVTDEQFAQVDLEPETFHAEWNDNIKSKIKKTYCVNYCFTDT